MDEEKKVAHEALLKEMHKADDLVEKHSELAITLTGVAFGFAATQLRSPHIVYMASAFGLLIAIEWVLKTTRHKQIFMAARSRLAKIDTELGIDTARPVSKLNGFTILQYLAFIIGVGWILMSFAVFKGWIPEKLSSSASNTLEKVSEELPALSHIPDSNWVLASMIWHEQTHTYDLSVFAEGRPQDTWAVVYDTDRGRIVQFKKQ